MKRVVEIKWDIHIMTAGHTKKCMMKKVEKDIQSTSNDARI